MFKALADRHRVKILNTLIAAAGDEVCVCEFTDGLPLKQSTVSYHLKQLVDAGLILRQRRGTFAYYRIGPEPWSASARCSPHWCRRPRLSPDSACPPHPVVVNET